MKMLLEAGLLHGDRVTVTGKTVAEVLADVPSSPPKGQTVVFPMDKPVYSVSITASEPSFSRISVFTRAASAWVSVNSKLSGINSLWDSRLLEPTL